MSPHYFASSAWTGRFPRTTGAAFKDADYATAFWPHEPEPVSLWSAVAYWAAIVLCVLAFVLLSGCGPSDIDAERASAASHQDAIEAARAEAIANKIAAHRQARAEFFHLATTTESTK